MAFFFFCISTLNLAFEWVNSFIVCGTVGVNCNILLETKGLWRWWKLEHGHGFGILDVWEGTRQMSPARAAPTLEWIWLKWCLSSKLVISWWPILYELPGSQQLHYYYLILKFVFFSKGWYYNIFNHIFIYIWNVWIWTVAKEAATVFFLKIWTPERVWAGGMWRAQACTSHSMICNDKLNVSIICALLLANKQ